MPGPFLEELRKFIDAINDPYIHANLEDALLRYEGKTTRQPVYGRHSSHKPGEE